jgi:uncharacterized damage-inducible protein DinB
MSTKNQLMAEIKQEAINTRKILAKVPFDKPDWKPHEKSMSIGKLATHIAENLRWGWYIVESDFVDFANRPFSPTAIKTNDELLKIFEEHYDKAIAALENSSDEALEKTWVVKSGDTIFMELKKKVAIRAWAMNHSVHHRGQLSVYLRLLDIPVPGMYGQSADGI